LMEMRISNLGRVLWRLTVSLISEWWLIFSQQRWVRTELE
jgi:hypothetical protein